MRLQQISINVVLYERPYQGDLETVLVKRFGLVLVEITWVDGSEVMRIGAAEENHLQKKSWSGSIFC